jgi:hypothetical protein
LEAIDKSLSQIANPGPFDKDVWPEIFMEIIRPLIRNMRDVRRYAATIPGTVRDLDGQLALQRYLRNIACRRLFRCER